MTSALPTILLLLGVFLFVLLLYAGRGFFAWSVAASLGIAAWVVAGIESPSLFWSVTLLTAACAGLFGVPALRRGLVAAPLMRCDERRKQLTVSLRPSACFLRVSASFSCAASPPILTQARHARASLSA